eukprot:TRINITY_DN4439_c0_g1_i2.p1 TRINITY_DN4439_c0_g1~~TRINITY_DN4439_c0_g1_i2.p1  ORF type:complete len:320 (-),score=71.46 TRINITY_DN4439_c0_g1_i2:355-1173(-)
MGACAAVYMACGVDVKRWASTYAETYHHTQCCGMSLVDAFERITHKILPDDAHVRCSGRVFISITLMGLAGPQNVIISEFESKEDLVNACLASANIPFFSTHGVGRKFRGRHVLDGGVTNNTPLFTDTRRRQIVFRLFDIVYPSALALSATDPCIEALVLRGAMEMRMFVLGHLSGKCGIRWFQYDPQKRRTTALQQIKRQKGTGLLALCLFLLAGSSSSTYAHILKSPALQFLSTSTLFRFLKFIAFICLYGKLSKGGQGSISLRWSVDNH